jgi:CheY-specific phosphatase CheX
MSAEKARIYLVGDMEAPWSRAFIETVGDRYDIAELSPQELVTHATAVTGVKGVVVFYEHDPTEANSEWFSRIRACVHYVDLPLIAVTPRPSATTRARLMTAGASTVCDASTEAELVLQEVENRCNIEPVMEDLRSQLLEPFVEAVVLTMTEMANSKVGLHSVYRKLGYRIFGDYSALVSIKAESEGTLVLSFSTETGHELARRMLAPLGVEATEELTQSCVAETANIVVGQAKGRLAGTSFGFSMSVPTVVAGHNHEIRYKQGLPCLVASFTSDIGDFALQICMAF